MPIEQEFWVVDRLEGDLVVVVSDDGRTAEVPVADLPPGGVDGLVFRVPRGEDGLPLWRDAMPDEEETGRRLEEAEGMLEGLKKRDPGGDVVL